MFLLNNFYFKNVHYIWQLHVLFPWFFHGEAVQKVEKMSSNNIESAKVVGQKVAQRAIEAGVTKVVFDRSGYKYHGRIKAIAESAREASGSCHTS